MSTNNTGDLVTRIYANFRGVDFRGEEINIVRSPDSLNVWKDYRHTESIRTRPGLKLHTAFTEPIYGIYCDKNMMLVHSGKSLYRLENGRKYSVTSSLRAAPSNGFVYKSIWYFLDGANYFYYDKEKEVFDVVEGYVPTTSIARKPSGGGEMYEDVNMLSDWRRNTFLADGESFDFYLDAKNIDSDAVPTVTVDGEKIVEFEVDYAAGKISLLVAPPAPKTDGRDNVEVVFKKVVPGYRDIVMGCTMLQVFDNRVFVSGNNDHPNTVWHCSLNDPTYFADTDYYREGMDSAAIKGLVAGNNALWVFREPSSANTTVFYHTPAIDDEYGKIYPSAHSSITTGCVGKAINFNDDIVFFSERGMEGISGDVTTEQAVAHRSSLVDRKMIAEPDYKNMILEEWEGYLFVFIGNKVYLADSRTAFTNENHIEYDWFYWHLDKKVTCTAVHDGVLYLGTDSGIYTLTDTNANIESYWTTPKDKFKNPHKLKTTSKKSCTVEAVGEEITVYAKTNKDADFEILGTYINVTDAFSCRIKKKKFKDIQLKFYSTKRFALETATLDCYIGGYLKNL